MEDYTNSSGYALFGKREVIELTNRFTIALVFVLCIVLFGAPAAAYTTELTVTKYDPYGAVVDTQTITWEEMRDTMPVYGDGVTHYLR
jgi:hypothetical protein